MNKKENGANAPTTPRNSFATEAELDAFTKENEQEIDALMQRLSNSLETIFETEREKIPLHIREKIGFVYSGTLVFAAINATKEIESGKPLRPEMGENGRRNEADVVATRSFCGIEKASKSEMNHVFRKLANDTVPLSRIIRTLFGS